MYFGGSVLTVERHGKRNRFVEQINYHQRVDRDPQPSFTARARLAHLEDVMLAVRSLDGCAFAVVDWPHLHANLSKAGLKRRNGLAYDRSDQRAIVSVMRRQRREVGNTVIDDRPLHLTELVQRERAARVKQPL